MPNDVQPYIDRANAAATLPELGAVTREAAAHMREFAKVDVARLDRALRDARDRITGADDA